MSSLPGWLWGMLAAIPLAGAQNDPKTRPQGDRIEIPLVEVHMTPANVGGGIPVTSPNPKPGTSDAQAGDDLDREPRVGDRLVIHGKYNLHSRDKARISLILDQPKGQPQPVVFTLSSVEVKKGSGDFELTYVPPRAGFLSIAFFSIPENKRFHTKPMTVILPVWTGTFGPERDATERPSAEPSLSR